MGLIKQLVPLQVKFTPATDLNWTRIETLIHGPGASEISSAPREGDVNTAVFSCLFALSLSYVEPPLRVWKMGADGKQTWFQDHPLQRLLDHPTPNGELTPRELWFWTQWAKHTDGNAYWRKYRAGDPVTGNVVQIWPVSPALMGPVTELDQDGKPTAWISYYRQQVGPQTFERVPVENVVHFRLGLDDRDMRKGLATLKRLARSISTDDEANQFTNSLLKNYAVPGLVVIPAANVTIDRDNAERIKTEFRRKFSGENRGEVAVISRDSKLQQFGFSPKDMDMGTLHRIPEERIAGAIGVPPIIAGLGVGLDRSTYSNFREAREMFTEQKLVPNWSWDSEKINVSLKPDFASRESVFCAFDLAKVRVLQEDKNRLYERLDIGVKSGWITRNEARTRAEDGFDTIPEWDEADMAKPVTVSQTANGTVSMEEAEELRHGKELNRAERL